MGIFPAEMTPKNCTRLISKAVGSMPSFRQAQLHGLHGVSLLPLANYVHMRSVILNVHEVVDCKTQQVLEQKSIHLVPIT